MRFIEPLWRDRQLIQRLSVREVQGRYRGTALGMGWSVLQPLLMLAVYTFIFAGIFRSRWGPTGSANDWTFALNLFAGLITFNLFAECATRAPSLVTAVPNYVKKVIFPIEILPAVSVCAAGYHAITSLVILMIFRQIAGVAWHPTVLILPVIWAPLIGLCLGLGWLLSALGVFLKDLPQATGLAVNVLLFMSAVFYPVSALPKHWETVLALNPLLQLIEKTRDVLLRDTAPSLTWIAASLVISCLFCEVSFRIFQKARSGFSDVI